MTLRLIPSFGMPSAAICRTFALAAVFASLAACSSSPKKNPVNHQVRKDTMRLPFKESDLKQSAQRTMLVGRAAIRDRVQGGQRTAPNIDVLLNPVSPVSDQWYSKLCRQGKVLEGPVDPRYKAHIFTSKTNEFGQFVFMDVPEGEYYLTTRMYWMDEKPFSGPVQYGGLMTKKIHLAGGTNTVNLDDSDACPPYFN